jgi:uncharacterized iron-regulated protein
MLRKIPLLLLLSLTFYLAQAQKVEGYVIFDKKGKRVTYEKMLAQLLKNDIILFGEYHNNPISHWLQYELTNSLNRDRGLILGAEMFEADNQKALDKYLAGEITAKGLDSTARLWKNYKTDYAPLVDFAKERKLEFIATNIPRKYASMVSKGGFEILDTLTTQEKSWIAPLPIMYDPELPGYKNMMTMMGDHANVNFPKAQAIKDATMAHFILLHFESGKRFLHYNGAYHSDNYEGILWYLKQKAPKLSYGTISTVQQANVQKLDKENMGKADFIICVDAEMTGTY